MHTTCLMTRFGGMVKVWERQPEGLLAHVLTDLVSERDRPRSQEDALRKEAAGPAWLLLGNSPGTTASRQRILIQLQARASLVLEALFALAQSTPNFLS
ncbi:hypothetical protein VTI28DRAFT_7283 [Corynascus sepedonium]